MRIFFTQIKNGYNVVTYFDNCQIRTDSTFGALRGQASKLEISLPKKCQGQGLTLSFHEKLDPSASPQDDDRHITRNSNDSSLLYAQNGQNISAKASQMKKIHLSHKKNQPVFHAP